MYLTWGYSRLNLYRAFEKAVNADKDRKNGTFDHEANRLTGLAINEVENLRNFYNRIKHVQRNKKDIAFLEKSESNFKELVVKLKSATDNSIFNRIG